MRYNFYISFLNINFISSNNLKSRVMKKLIKERLVILLKTDVRVFNRYIKFSLNFNFSFRADLRYADLSSANLRYADLSSANLRYADLRYADLSSADLSSADLRYANLSSADLSSANLRYANLSSADLSSANLRYANLSSADLSSANFNESTGFLLSQCPEEGCFIAWKKASSFIVKLQIIEDSKRSSATSLKCRCSSAMVLAIENIDRSDSGMNKIASDYNSEFIYEIGKIVSVDDFDEDRFNECSTGIHFFLSRDMAVKYN